MESSFHLPAENLSSKRFRFGDLLVPPFRLTVELLPDGHGGMRCLLQGSLGNRTVQDFKRVLRQVLDHAPETLAIDLAGLKRMDPRGLAALAEVSAWGRKTQCRVLILNPQSRDRRTIMLASLHQILDVVDT